MPETKVMREQFEWTGDRLTHKPTGFTYSRSGTAGMIKNLHGGLDHLPNGDDFDIEEITSMAKMLLFEKP